ncbi:MAG: MMPL family transporter, partial [Candidatus Binatia bacterium]
RAVLSAPFDLSAARNVVQDPLGVRRLAAAGFADAYGEAAPSLSGGYFTASDGQALLLLVRPKQSAFDITFSERLMHQVRDAEAAARQAAGGAGVMVAYTGSYVYALEDAGTLRWDVARYTTLALFGVLAVFYVGYRDLRILPFVTYPLVVTTLLTFALSLLLFEQLNAVSISFAAILYGLAIDSAIYFYSRLQQERRGRDLRSAVTATLAGLGRANVAASTTTAAAFLVIGFSCLAAVSQLGLLTALGMLLTTIEFFTLYPALAFFLSGRPENDVSVPETGRLARCAHSAAAHATSLGVGAAIIAVGLMFAARRVTLDVTLTHLRPQDSAAARVQNAIEARFGEHALSGAVLVRRPDLEEALVDGEAIAQRLRSYKSEGLLRASQSVEAVLPSARVQQARLARYNELPRAAAVEALKTALVRHGFVPQRFADFFAEIEPPRAAIVRIDDPALAPLRFLVDHHVRRRNGEYIVATYVQPAAGVSLRAISERLHRDLRDVPFTLAARSLLEDELGHVLRRELTAFFALGLVGNFMLLLISFGSVGTAVAILAPVVLVVIALFAAMSAIGIALDPVNLIVTPLIFGIGVDYGVYIVARAREHGGVVDAIRYAGRAVVMTALTTITGFGFLGMSRFPPLSTMGTLAGAGLFLCVALSITLLPALLTIGSRLASSAR